MAFSPEFIRAFSRELDGCFKERAPRVSRIEGGDSWVALCLGAEWLLFSWESRKNGLCWAAEGEVMTLKKSAPARTPLVEFLKSQILRAQLTGASQLQDDRVIRIDAKRLVGAGFFKERGIVFEATEPNGNFLLLDESSLITDLARHSSPDENRYRTLLPGHAYTPPPPFAGLDLAELDALEYEHVRNIKGIGRQLADLIQAHWSENSPEGWLSALRMIRSAGEAGEEKNSGCVFQVSGKGYLTLAPAVFPECRGLGESARAAAGILISGLLGGVRERLLSHSARIIDRAVRGKERHREGLEKQVNRSDAADDLKTRGQLILEHISEIPARAESVSLSFWGAGEADDKVRVELDPELSAAQNAERYFKKYRKAQANAKKLAELRGEIDSIDRAIEELTEQKELLRLIDDVTELEYAVRDISDWLSPPRKENGNRKKKNDKIPAHLRYDIEGALVLVGLNARGNRYVTFRQASPDDLWLHAHDIPGSHVIIKGRADDEVIEFAASLAAYYSKGKGSPKVQVDCTRRKNVRSIPGSAMAHVTYTNPRTIFAAPKRQQNI